MSEKLIIRIDASSLSESACWRKFQLLNPLGYVSNIKPPWLDFGAALHSAIAEWSRARALGTGLDVTALIRKMQQWYAEQMCEKKEPRDVENLGIVLTQYFEVYARENFQYHVSKDVVSVELPFAIPYRSYEDVDVLLCGAMDALGTVSGRKCFRDTKHSSTTAIDAHLESQLMRPQFHIYAWVLKHLGYTDYYPPVLVDAIYINKKYRGGKFTRSQLTDLQPQVIERVMTWVSSQVDHMVQLVRKYGLTTEAWPYNFNNCEGDFGMPCPFFNLCQAPEQFQQTLLNSMFTRREYNPKDFNRV